MCNCSSNNVVSDMVGKHLKECLELHEIKKPFVDKYNFEFSYNINEHGVSETNILITIKVINDEG